MRKRCIQFVFFLMAGWTSVSQAAATDASKDAHTQISGKLRMYDFIRDYGKKGVPNQSAFSLGGELGILSPLFFSGFQVGGTLYTAQPLGLNGGHGHVDNTLPGYPVTTLGQAYAQFKRATWLVRVGDQFVQTPWLGASDSRMIPATYQGVVATWQLLDALKLTALRVWRFKGRTEDDFAATDLYNSDHQGGSPVSHYDRKHNPGAFAVGAQFKQDAITSQAWFYQFFNRANLMYADGKYVFNKSNTWRPVVAAQALREWGDGNNQLAAFTNGAANSTAGGVLFGVETDRGNVTLAYNKIRARSSGFHNGDILSPYSTGYATDPLYTTTMIAGLVEKSSGSAVKLAASYFIIPERWQVAGDYAKYYTSPRLPNTHESDFDTTYHFAGNYKGLSLRYRLGLENGDISKRRFIYSRVMAQYSFY